jgi:hypothetical protein
MENPHLAPSEHDQPSGSVTFALGFRHELKAQMGRTGIDSNQYLAARPMR